MFPGQETPSPSCKLYLLREGLLSPIFIRLYLRLDSVPLHFLSLSLSTPGRGAGGGEPAPTLGRSFYSDAVTTTCKHSGICNSNAAKRAHEGATQPPPPAVLEGVTSYPASSFCWTAKDERKEEEEAGGGGGICLFY